MYKVRFDPTSLQTRARHCREIATTIKDDSIRERLMLMAAEYESLATKRFAQEQSVTVDELKQRERR